MTTTLRRMTERPIALEHCALSEKAAKVLGYQKLAMEESATRDELVLFDACVAAGVRPFQTAAVDAYKRKHLTSLRQKVGRAILIAASVAVVASFALAMVLSQVWPLFGLPAAFFLFFVGGPILLAGAPVRSWREQSFSEVSDPVPAGVLDIALRLREKCPGSGFVVHSLQEERRTFDPFLSVKYGRASFYIAVWDEPEFNAKYE